MSTLATANIGYGFKLTESSQCKLLPWYSSKYGWTDINVPQLEIPFTAVNPGIYAQQDYCTLSWLFLWTPTITTTDNCKKIFCDIKEQECKEWIKENTFPLNFDWFIYLSS